MRVTTRHRPADPADFVVAARRALLVLSRQPGFRSGELARSPDDPSVYLLAVRWADAGSMRRGMGGFEAKVALAAVMASAEDGPSVFEVLCEVGTDSWVDAESDLSL